MNPIFAAALEIQEFCVARQFRFCFIGGLAVQRWGEPRLTVDVDLTLLTGFGAELRPLLALKGTPEAEERLQGLLRAARRGG